MGNSEVSCRIKIHDSKTVALENIFLKNVNLSNLPFMTIVHYTNRFLASPYNYIRYPFHCHSVFMRN